MASLGDIIKISQADYDTLVTNGSITKDGVTYTYSDNNLYLVEGVNDIVKLWTNADPNNQYGFTNIDAINISNLSSYKYLIIKYKYYYSSTNQNWGSVFITIEYKPTGDFTIFGANNQSGCEISASRNFIINNNTITFGHAYCVNIGSTNSELNDHFCIPLEIYGTNTVLFNGSEGIGGLAAYPVGSIYMSVNTTSPENIFGGSWTSLGQAYLSLQEQPNVVSKGLADSDLHNMGHAVRFESSSTPGYISGQSNIISMTTANDGTRFLGESGAMNWDSLEPGLNDSIRNNPVGYSNLVTDLRTANNSSIAVYMWKRTA